MEHNETRNDLRSRLTGFFTPQKRNVLLEVLWGLLSFGLPFVLLIALFASHGFAPFAEGGPTTMMLDQRDQYISYLRYYQAILKGDGSLIYTMGKIFGGDFMSIFTYYLASPFNFLIIFLNAEDLPSFFTFSAIFKLAFASLNFYLLCRFALKKRNPLYLVFGLGFALMSYNLVYMSNFMYLDVIMVLPLVILGIHFLEEGKARWLYMIALAYALATSWYLGAMVCIFVVLYFLARLLVTENRLAFAYRFGAFSLLGGLLAAAFWLTAFLHFEGTKATASMPRQNEFLPLTIFFSGWLENGYSSTSDISRNTGYMTMFVGVVGLVFVLLYPFNAKFHWKERLGDFVLFGILCICSISTVLSALWHGGREPSWFPTRFSFLMGFLVCYLGAKEASQISATKKRGLIVPLVALAVCLPIVLLVDNKLSKVGTSHYAFSVVSLVLYLLTLGLVSAFLLVPEFKSSKKNWVKSAIFVGGVLSIGVVSCYRGACRVVESNLKVNAYASSLVYAKDCKLLPAVDYVKSLEPSPAFRMEMTFNRPGGTNVINNNPLFYHYNGLNHYSSSEKKNVSDFMKKLGFHINPFYETYDGGSTSAINAYLGVRYLIDDGEGSGAYEPIFQRNPNGVYQPFVAERDDYAYYKNELALPLGFVSEKQGATYVNQGERREGKETVYWFDDLEYQDSIYSTVCHSVVEDGKAKKIFHAIPVQTQVSSGLTYSEDEHGIRTYSGGLGQIITLTFTVPEEYYGQNLYFGVKDTADRFSFTIDGRGYRVNDYFYSGIKGFADTGNHQHTIRIIAKEPLANVQVRPEVYAEDSNVLREYLTALKSGGLKDAKEIKGMFSYGFSGTFDYEGGDKEFLFTLPYEKEIQIKLDGKSMPVLQRNDVFSAISLAGVSTGSHQIEIIYFDKPFVVGFIVSAVALAIAVPALIFSPRLEAKLTKKKKEAPETEA